MYTREEEGKGAEVHKYSIYFLPSDWHVFFSLPPFICFSEWEREKMVKNFFLFFFVALVFSFASFLNKTVSFCSNWFSEWVTLWMTSKEEKRKWREHKAAPKIGSEWELWVMWKWRWVRERNQTSLLLTCFFYF